MNISFYQKDIKRIWKENNFSYDYEILSNGHIHIIVEHGDWKHDHLALKYIMRKNHYRVIDMVDYPNGDDSYTAYYKFVYGV